MPISTGSEALDAGADDSLAIMENTHPGFLRAWDPYPFILLNLVLSFQAAHTGPVVMSTPGPTSNAGAAMPK